MIGATFDYLRAVVQGRSAKWPALRRRWLAEHSTCAACGRKDGLEVHHIFPVHAFPGLELDELNLITLCRRDHAFVAHLGDWDSWNPTVVADARQWLRKIEARPYKR